MSSHRHSTRSSRFHFRIGGGVALWLLATALVPAVGADEGRSVDYSYRSMLQDTHWLTVNPPSVTASTESQHEAHWFADPEVVADDLYMGVSHSFGAGVDVDTGIAAYADREAENRYREYYFGLSYEALEGRVWYTDDYLGLGGSKSSYELGVKGKVRNDIALVARLGYSTVHGEAGMENFAAFVLSAEKPDVYGFGLNLQLVGSQDPRWADNEDFRLMGTISREFR